MRKRCFVIVTEPRSGSYHLCALLDSLDDVVCHGEVFKGTRVELRPRYRRPLSIKLDDVDVRDADPLGFLKRLRDLNPRKVFGFKALRAHIIEQAPLHAGIIMSSSWKKIFLTRNPLESYVSILRVSRTNQWVKHLKHKEKVFPRGRPHQDDRRDLRDSGSPADTLCPRVTFDSKSFEDHIRNHNGLISLSEQVRKVDPAAHFEFDYRDFRNWDQFARLLSFIGSSASPGDLSSDREKQFRQPLFNAFTNWPEFEAYVTRAGLSRYLPRR